MQRSTDRFLTTHTGSLPRPDDLVKMMFAKEEGVPVDLAALDNRIASAVAEVVAIQRKAGVDIVNDGELSKPSYATYIKDRVDGFNGASEPLVYRDLVDFPGMAQRVYGDPGRSRRKMPACTAPLKRRAPEAAAVDVAHLKAALGSGFKGDAFVSAASPGVVALFFANRHYPDRQAYLDAIVEVMRPEYEALAAAGFIIQLDCPDLGMGRHIVFTELSYADWREAIRQNFDALDRATANIPPEQLRLHLCWGNYDGPHHFDVPIADIIDLVFKTRPAGISFEAANPRHNHEWELFETVKLPDGKVLIPGVIESKTNFIEHPQVIAQRIGRYANLVGRENVIAGSDCGYGTWVGQAAVDRDIVWAKLAAMAEGAKIASKTFWK